MQEGELVRQQQEEVVFSLFKSLGKIRLLC